MTKEATIQATGPCPHGVPLGGVGELDDANYPEDYGNASSRSFPDRACPHLARYQQPTTATPMTMSVSSLVDMTWLSLPEPRLVAASSPVTERPLNQR